MAMIAMKHMSHGPRATYVPRHAAYEGCDSELLADDLKGLHESRPGAKPPPDPDEMSFRDAMRSPRADEWCEAITKERLDLGETFPDGRPALVRVHKNDMPTGARVYNSVDAAAGTTTEAAGAAPVQPPNT